MELVPDKFVKKPVEIEAVKLPVFMGEAIPGVTLEILEYLEHVNRWCSGQLVHYHGGVNKNKGYSIFISTLEGTMEATPGDWIIKGVEGEFYPCKPEIFKKSYDRK